MDLPRSIALLDRECEVRDEPWACTSLGYAYNLGLGVETDACKAKALHEKSCALENQLGCANLSDHLIHERCAVRDLKRAETLATKSCEAINRGCASLGWIAETGANAKADKARALALYRKGCSAGDAYACERLGIFFAQGIVVEKDPQAAMEKYEESCRLGRPDACSLALKLASSSKAQPADLAALKARACSFGVGPCP